ncbi:MAG: glycoside hydrolase family 2 protein [Sedimentisphaeraceae bacterium JB056]
MDQNKKNDVFADIASQRISYRDKQLVEPTPVKLEEKYLPSENDADAAFSPAEHIDNAEKLSTELEKRRQQYKPFMQNHAPAIKDTRKKIGLTEFDWRVETENDKKNFLSVLSGDGQWEQVNVPHYGEPLGLAVTYYRTSFNITQEQLDTGAAFIHFKGVDYKAHVFINGTYLGSHEGFFAPFEFDFTGCACVGENTLVVKVENDFIMGSNNAWNGTHCGEKIYAATGLGYDEPYYGWHHCPPGMGIYQDVYVEFRPKIFVSDIFVRPLLTEKSAQANIELHSCDIGEKAVDLRLSLYGRNFKKTIFEGLVYKPSSNNISGLNDDLNIAFAKADGTYNKPIPLFVERGKNSFNVSFDIENPNIWSLETPWLYQLHVEVIDNEGNLIDASEGHFGMRSFRMDENSDPKGQLYFNEKPIRLRGANTMGHEQQCVFKKDFDQLIDDILLAKICNMNFLRLTQRPVQQEIYDYCDMLGLMTQSDLPTFGCITRTQYNEALRQVAEVEKLVRSHPCNIMMSYINEPFPNGKNKPHRNISRNEMEDFFRAADDIVHHLNPDRVIKPCDGDYDPPAAGIQDRHCYTTWYNGQGLDIGMLIKGHWQPTKPDWYYGCGEFGAEGLESAEIMRKYYPTSWLPQSEEQEKNWTPSKIFKAQTGMFHYFFFDTRNSLKDWIEASQQHQARSLKILTEAFRRDNRMVTFAVHLFIDAFPSGWMKTIMDCERNPKKGYFAYRSALAPILPTIRTDRTKFFSGEKMRFEAWISNDKPQTQESLTLHYQLECNGEIIFSQKADAKIEACKSTFQGYIEIDAPEIDNRQEMKLQIAIIDNNGKLVNDNYADIEVFPQIEIPDTEVSVIGHNGPGKKLANEIGLKNVPLGNSDIIIISDYTDYLDNKKQIDTMVSNGATAIFMGLVNEDKYDIAGSIIDVKSSRFNPLHFVSRKTNHELVEGFKEFDFNYWYDPSADMISPVVETTFTGDDIKPILNAGNADDNSNWCQVIACGEKKHGKGSFIVNQLNIAGRTSTNPTAKMFAMRLLGLQCDNIKNKGMLVS